MSDIITVQNQLSLPQPISPVASQISKRIDMFCTVLGGGTDQQQFAASVILACNELPLGSTTHSVAKAVLGAAYLQLPFGSHLGFAYMLPFRNSDESDRQKKGVYDISLCIGYQGFLELGVRSKFLTDIHADVVCKDEEFEFWKDETGPRLLHKPGIDRSPGRNNIIGAYCLYHTSGGGRGIRFVSAKEIALVDKNKDVWRSNFPAMCMKTAVRRAAKEWRKTPQIGYAVQVDEQTDRDEVALLPPVNIKPEMIPEEPANYKLPMGGDEEQP